MSLYFRWWLFLPPPTTTTMGELTQEEKEEYKRLSEKILAKRRRRKRKGKDAKLGFVTLLAFCAAGSILFNLWFWVAGWLAR